MQQIKRAFHCTYSPNLPELLQTLKCSLVITTYQAGKVVIISSERGKKLIQLARNFNKPMGIALADQKLAIATLRHVYTFANAPALAKKYPKKPNTYDALYLPRATYCTGPLDLHDLAWGKGGWWGVNTRFSCLCLINEQYSFETKWQPPFISQLRPEDRCHLNGMAMKNGLPAYVTALGQSDQKEGWRSNKVKGGILMDVSTKQIILDGLPMPHSPRLFNQKLYLLLSASGELVSVDLATKSYKVLTNLGGFARGMVQRDHYLFIGLSKIRKTSKNFQQLPVSNHSNTAGIVVVDMNKQEVIGEIKYHNTLDEIYDVQILPDMLRPNIVRPGDPIQEWALSSPTVNFWKMK